MRRTSYYPYVFLVATLFFFLSLPPTFTHTVRSWTIASIAPSWRGLHFLKQGTLYLLTLPTVGGGRSLDVKGQIEELKRENQILHSQLDNMRQWLLSEDRIEEQILRLKQITGRSDNEPYWREFFKRRAGQVSQVLELQFQSLPAKVIFREPASWSSFVWLNVGEKQNKLLGKQVIAKNSPVVVGTSLIGIVEEVGSSQCRVRLITDSHLIPSVRTLRGNQQNALLWQQLEELFTGLESRKDLFDSREEERYFLSLFNKMKAKIGQQGVDRYLAKGELYGNSTPLWRARNPVLHGVGFNYDWADSEGPARDLRTGTPLDALNTLETISILKEGDLLVTSGLDGIFPPGLQVAVVSKVENLREGATAYEIEARVAAGNINELSTVFVLPPLHFQKP